MGMANRNRMILTAAAMAVVPCLAQAAAFLNTTGTYNTAANWSPATVPTGIDAVAGGKTASSSAATVTLDISPTVGSISTSASNSTWTLLNGGTNSFTMDTAGDHTTAATISAAGRNSIVIGASGTPVNITINDHLTITKTMSTASESREVAIFGTISGTGNINISNTVTAGTGNISVGNLNNTGTVIIGNAVSGTAGTVTINGIGANVTAPNATGSGANTLALNNTVYTLGGTSSLQAGTLTLGNGSVITATAGG